MKTLTLLSTFLLLVSSLFAQGKYGDANTQDEKFRIPSCVKPEFDYWIRDTWVTLGDDRYYYMTGTTADPNREFVGQKHCWDWNDGLYLWRSKDMKNWEHMGLIWSLDKDATWQSKPKVFKKGEKYPKKSINGDPMDNKFRAVWAPELHYIKSRKNWFIVACMNNSKSGQGSFILRSTSGKPEGPYVNIEANKNKPLFPRIDGSLFEDTDGTVYFVGHNHSIAKMKPDMSGFAEEIHDFDEKKFTPEPYIEGAFIFKHNGKYNLVQTVWSHRLADGSESYAPEIDSNKTRYSYDCLISTADNIYGPYGERYNAITGGGHNNFFQDKEGKWWSTMFYNPRGAQAKEYEVTCRPGLIPVKFVDNKFMPDATRCNSKDLSDKSIYLADPTIISADNKYIMYGTEKRPQGGFPVFVSEDMKIWETPSAAPDGYALKKGGQVFGDVGFWAPQIFRYKGKYCMAYTANENIAIAYSETPYGPFRQNEVKPLKDGRQIDPFIFFDTDGKIYLYYVRLNKGNSIWVAEMNENLDGIKEETLKQCIVADQPWEDTHKVQAPPIIEGPTVIKRNNTYYLFYSANDFRSVDYAVGYATSDTPFGPWKKSSDSPVISRNNIGMNGTGHGDLFQDAKGNWHYVFHVHNSDTEVHDRRTAIVDIKFEPNEATGIDDVIVDSKSLLLLKQK